MWHFTVDLENSLQADALVYFTISLFGHVNYDVWYDSLESEGNEE